MKIVNTLLSLLLAVGVAQAAPKKSSAQKSKEESRERAEMLFSQSKAYYNVHEYQRALDGFKEAYILSQEPVLLLNMGQCFRYMGQYQDAIVSFQTFLQEDPATPYRENVDALLLEMQQKLDELKAPAPITDIPAQGPAPAPKQSLPPEMLSDEPYRVPTFLYGATAGAFVLGAGAGGLAVVLSRQEQDLIEQNVAAPSASNDALIEEKQQQQKSAKGALIGLGVISVATATTGALLYRHHKKQKQEKQEPIAPIFDAPVVSSF